MKDSFELEVSGFGRVVCEPRGAKGIYHASTWLNGEHVRRSLKTSNKKAATKIAPDVVRQLASTPRINGSGPPPVVSFDEAKTAYLNSLRHKLCPAKTIQQVGLHIDRFFSIMRKHGVNGFEQLRPIHADVFRTELKLHAKTVVNHYGGVKAMLRYCESRELIQRDPFARISNQRPRHEMRTLPTLALVNAILQNTDRFYFVLIAALAFLGCRVSELCRIRTSDVDLSAGTIVFRKPAGVRSKTCDDRIVPIHPRLAEILKDYCRPKSEWFFCTQPSPRNRAGGRKIKAELVNTAFKNAAKAVGQVVGRSEKGGLTLHSLRGFFKTTAILSGVPKEVVDVWQGHKADRSVSIQHYFSLPLDDSRRLMASVNFNS